MVLHLINNIKQNQVKLLVCDLIYQSALGVSHYANRRRNIKKVMEIFFRIGNHNMTVLSEKMYGYDCEINPEKKLMHLDC